MFSSKLGNMELSLPPSLFSEVYRIEPIYKKFLQMKCVYDSKIKMQSAEHWKPVQPFSWGHV